MSRYVDVNLYIGKKKIGIGALVAVLTVLAAVACLAVIIMIPGRGIMTVSQAKKILTNERYIIHAGGLVAGDDGVEYSYTNSLEALNNCYEKGNHVSEFDFMITADDEVVCAHGDDEEELWAHGVEGAGTNGNPPTLDHFKDAHFEGFLSTMSLDDLAAFMQQHSDFYVVTDVKDDNVLVCRAIREKYPKLMNNFIIQIYHEDEYEKIRKLGFSYIIYTLYRATDDELLPESLKYFINETNLTGICFWDDFCDEFPESFEVLKESHLPLFVHTINDKEDMRAYFDRGISAVYTDVVNREDRLTEGE